jgi:hypothetical protein
MVDGIPSHEYSQIPSSRRKKSRRVTPFFLSARSSLLRVCQPPAAAHMEHAGRQPPVVPLIWSTSLEPSQVCSFSHNLKPVHHVYNVTLMYIFLS